MAFLIGVTAADIQALPTSGAGWTNVLAKANAVITPSSTDISSQEGNKAFAAGLIYNHKLASDPGNAAAYKAKVVAACQTVAGDAAQAVPTTGWLSVGALDHQVANRMTAGYVLAADLVGHRDADMLAFADKIRTKTLTGFTYTTMESCGRNFAGNHGTLARASYAACCLFIADATNFARTAPWHYCFCGDRTRGHTTYTTLNGDHADGFSPDSSGWTFEQTWFTTGETTANWTPISPAGGDLTRDGALIMEVIRQTTSTNVNYSVDGSGHPVWGADYPGDAAGAAYFDTNMAGAMLHALLLEKNGYPDAWTCSANAIRRCWEHLYRYPDRWGSPNVAQHAFSVHKWTDSLIQQRYPGAISGPGFPQAAAGGYGFGFTDWLVIAAAAPAGTDPAERLMMGVGQ